MYRVWFEPDLLFIVQYNLHAQLRAIIFKELQIAGSDSVRTMLPVSAKAQMATLISVVFCSYTSSFTEA